MLRRVEDGPAVVVCNTCRFTADQREDGSGQRGGALLVDAIRRVHDDAADYAAIAVQEMACLFACTQHCAVHVRAPGKIGYVLGRFTPDEDAAHAILDYARHHAASDDGQVRYADWPDGVKGHFLTRTPPEGYLA
jgi:predicted metal-binding protein